MGLRVIAPTRSASASPRNNPLRPVAMRVTAATSELSGQYHYRATTVAVRRVLGLSPTVKSFLAVGRIVAVCRFVSAGREG